MIKTHNKIGIEGNFVSQVKDISEKSSANVVLNAENVDAFHLRSETNQDVHPCHSIQHCIRGSKRKIRQEKELNWK